MANYRAALSSAVPKVPPEGPDRNPDFKGNWFSFSTVNIHRTNKIYILYYIESQKYPVYFPITVLVSE